ncbi:MAG: L-2-amino-thiazoline-4-carboxylic acid hydrolase, partial [Pseudomonadota bacterium]|nr:L-2-amino-thiazoline-4-carboxylic acid hydrolase [Pseudomonadota bacterium]
EELGFIFSCGRDGKMFGGFNPNIKFKRTQTIMQGAEYCDFRLSLEEGKMPSSTEESS